MATNPTKLFGYQLWITTQVWQRSLNKTLKHYDLTHAQYMIMQYIRRADKKEILSNLSQNKLALELALDPMMVSNVLTLLEKKKYILRNKSAGEGMWYQLSLTKAGKETLKKAHQEVEKLEEDLFNQSALNKVKKNFKDIIL